MLTVITDFKFKDDVTRGWWEFILTDAQVDGYVDTRGVRLGHRDQQSVNALLRAGIVKVDRHGGMWVNPSVARPFWLGRYLEPVKQTRIVFDEELFQLVEKEIETGEFRIGREATSPHAKPAVQLSDRIRFYQEII